MQTQPVMPIAAVVYTPEDDVETLLIEAARALAANGVRLGGVLQHDIGAATGDPCAMLLENVATGERINLSQELGSGSEACRLDPAALAEASVAIRAAIDDGVDLLIFNKFSTQEASGAGLRDEMGLAAVSGVPLLTAVGGRFLDEWKEFTGGECTLLEPRLPAILGWWQALRAETAA